MPMQFIVNQMTGNSPVTYYPPNEAEPQKRKPRTHGNRIPDGTLREALKLRSQGMSWSAIGHELGRSGHGLTTALRREGML